MPSNNYVCIMAGGIGSRFWPASRSAKPKQFLDILGTGKTLLQATYDRFLQLCPSDNIFILTNETYSALVKEQIPGIKSDQILEEPHRKNTAPCIAYAAFRIASENPTANILVAPSDHIIKNEDEFIRVAKLGLDFVSRHDALLTLGLRPSRPDTGYGYIQFEEEEIETGIHPVKTFTEKPNRATAQTFIKSGDFLWNAGIFLWNTRSILKALEDHLPDVTEAFADIKEYLGTEHEAKAVDKAFLGCPNISIDFGVMEKASNVYVLPASLQWSDLGTWASLYVEKEKDYFGNAVTGDNVVVYEAGNNMVHVPNKKMVVIQGLDNYIVVDTDDVLLIIQKDLEQKIKDITNDIKREKGEAYL
jgi:mannose-1-phosphate guanylyltransferase